MSPAITDSQFYMWRTLFALSHADHVVTDDEVRFMAEILEDVPFSEAQRTILNDDIRNARDVVEMFSMITDSRDQAQFFQFAREMVWSDGQYGPEEQEVMLKLQTMHVKGINLDDLVGTVELELEDEGSPSSPPNIVQGRKDVKGIVSSFLDRFRG